MLWLCSLWKSEEVVGRVGEEGNTRRGQGVLAVPRGAQLRSRGALLGVFGWWSLQAGISLYFFLFSLCSFLCFIDRERLQRCPVLEWLEGKPKCLTCIFFLLYCLSPNFHTSPCLFLIFFPPSLCCFFSSISTFYLSHLCIVLSPRHLFSLLLFLSHALSHFSLSSVLLCLNSVLSLLLSPLFLSSFFFLFFFTPPSRATYLSLQDGAVHP